MLHSFYQTFLYLMILVTFFIVFFFTPFIPNPSLSSEISQYELYPSGFVWPAPGYSRINSHFGKRTSPTQGASSYHKGVDIGAPEGAKLVAICDGTIAFADFLRWWWLYLDLNPRRLENYLLPYRP